MAEKILTARIFLHVIDGELVPSMSIQQDIRMDHEKLDHLAKIMAAVKAACADDEADEISL